MFNHGLPRRNLQPILEALRPGALWRRSAGAFVKAEPGTQWPGLPRTAGVFQKSAVFISSGPCRLQPSLFLVWGLG